MKTFSPRQTILLLSGVLIGLSAYADVPFRPIVIDAQFPRRPHCKAVGDINGDGFPDVVIGSYVDRIHTFKVADMNRDGRLDVVTAEMEQSAQRRVSVYWNLGQALRWHRQVIATSGSHNLRVADLNQDGYPDIITAEHRGTKKLEIWTTPNHGTTWTEHIVSRGIENHLGARVVDLDGDGDLDIVGIAWDGYPYLHVWRNDAIVRPRSAAPLGRKP